MINRRVFFACCALVLTIVLVAEWWYGSSPYELSSPVSEKLLEFSAQGPQGAVQPLSNFTDFEWDTVFVFQEGAKKKKINEITSSRIFKLDSGRYFGRSALLVFKHENDVVHALSASPPLYVFGTNHKAYKSEEALLYAHTKNPGPYTLHFVD